jgi:Tfp pilus assembly protein PilF
MLRAFISAILLAVSAQPLLSQSQRRSSSVNTAVDPETALKLAQQGKCDAALPTLRRASSNASANDLRRELGLAGVRCAMMMNQANAAAEFLRSLNRDFPNDPEVLYISVHTYSDMSTQAAQRLAAVAPNSKEAHELNAESLEVQGKWDLAQKEYEEVLKQNPREPGIHFRLGRLLLSKPNPPPTVADEAKKEFQQELEIDPNNAGAEYVLGELARQAQNWDEASRRFSRATSLDPSFADAFLGFGTALISQRKFAEAVSPLERAVKLEPRNPAAHYSLAMAYSRTGQKANAEREFAIHRQMVQKNSAEGAPAPPNSSPSPQ